MTTATHHRSALRASYTGLALTIIATILPYIDRGTTHVLADHIRSGYPSYSAEQIASAVGGWLAILSITGGLGVIGWIWTIWMIKGRKRWAPWSATTVFAIAVCIAAAGLFTMDTSGEVGLAPPLGLAGALPCLAGVVTVMLLWRKPSPQVRA